MISKIRSHRTSTGNNVLFAVIILFCAISIALVSSRKAGALSFCSQVPSKSGDPCNILPATDTYAVVSNENSKGSFYSPVVYSYLYVPIEQLQGNVLLIDRDGGYIDKMTVGIAPSCGLIKESDTLKDRINYPYTGRPYTLTPDTYSKITFDNVNQKTTATFPQNNPQYKVYCVVVQTSAPTNSFFKLKTTTPGAILANYAGTLESGTGYASNDPFSYIASKPTWDLDLSYGPPCTMTTAAPIKIYDLDMDSRWYAQNINTRIRMKRIKKDTGAIDYLNLSGDVTLTDALSKTYTPLANGTGGGVVTRKVRYSGKSYTTRYRDPTNPHLGDSYNYYWDTDSTGVRRWAADPRPNNVQDATEYLPYTNSQNTFNRIIWEVTPITTYSSEYKYILEITGMGSGNKVRVRLPYDQINSIATCTPPGDPVGTVDSCMVVNNRTYLYGWAYDDNSSTGDDPKVRLNVGGQTQDVTSPIDYRSGPINDFLTARSIGSSARDNRYGFSAVFDGLTKGGSYTLTGSVLNVGIGTDRDIGINNIAVPSDGVSGSLLFVGGKLPDGCLTDPPPALGCTVPPEVVEIGERFFPTVTINNSTGSDVSISGPANFSITQGPSPPITGSGRPYSNGSYSGFSVIGRNSSLQIRSDSAVTIPVTGLYSVKWDITLSPGVDAGGDCGKYVNNAVKAISKPYVKFYGNDVVAGGGFGDNCTIDNANASATAHMRIGNAGVFRGSSAELAIFAVNTVKGVRAGAGRSTANLSELVFANSGSGIPNDPTNYIFGGGYGYKTCVEDYWTNKAGDDYNPGVVVAGEDYPEVNLSNLATGNYIVQASRLPSGRLTVYASSSLPNGKRITLYVDGDVVIGRKRVSDGSLKFQNTSWTTGSQVPSLYIVANGNIYIDDSTTELDGVFVAQPKASNLSGSGEIHTCSIYSANIDLMRVSGAVPINIPPVTNLTAGEILARYCVRKLTINGAFIAQRTYLLRNNGTVRAAVANETYTSGNIAEVFRYAPEMFLVSGNGAPSSTTTEDTEQFDSILSLPPAF